MIEAARALLAEGSTPTVEEAAERAGVSRATAYRYFPNQRGLLLAAHPEIETASLLPRDPPDDPVERAALVATAIMRLTIDTEPELRAMLRLSLDPKSSQRELLLRKGRRMGWFEDALAPLRKDLGQRELRRLVLAVAAAVGIEGFVWLTDIAGLPKKDAADLLVWTARSIVTAAMGTGLKRPAI